MAKRKVDDQLVLPDGSAATVIRVGVDSWKRDFMVRDEAGQIRHFVDRFNGSGMFEVRHGKNTSHIFPVEALLGMWSKWNSELTVLIKKNNFAQDASYYFHKFAMRGDGKIVCFLDNGNWFLLSSADRDKIVLESKQGVQVDGIHGHEDFAFMFDHFVNWPDVMEDNNAE